MLREPFAYPDGPLVGQGGWAAHSGAGTKPIQVVGGMIRLVQSPGSGEDVNKTFAQQGPGLKTYASFTLVVPSTGPGGAPARIDTAYFAHFRGEPNPTIFSARVYVTRPSSPGNDYTVAIGVRDAPVSPPVNWTNDLDFDRPYRIVSAYDAATGSADLWVDPLDETSPKVTSGPYASATGNQLASYAFRQAFADTTASCYQIVDDLVVTTSFMGPAITRVEPNRGGSDGSVSAVIAGVGFQSGAIAKLARSGQPDIVGSQITVASDGRSLAATFDLAARVQGAWDVVVTNPDLGVAALPDGFTIEPVAPQRLRVGVIGPALMRPNRPKAFEVVLENRGNRDLLAVPLWITRIPADATVEPDFTVTPPPSEVGEPDWSQAPLTLTGPGGRYLPVVIPRVPPGISVRRLYLTVPNTVASFDLDAALTPPWADGEAFRSCLADAGVISIPTCMGSQLTAMNTYLGTTPGVEALSGIGLWAKIAWRCEGAASLPAALAKAEEVLDLMLQPIERTGVPAGCAAVLLPQWQDARAVRIVTSVDPNDKLADAGFGRSVARDQVLSYSIRFENADTASAPVQSLVVKDTLDGATLDFATLSLGPITFGDRKVHPPPGVTSYAPRDDIDLRPQQDLLVRVEASFDPFTGVLVWSLTSIDPVTGQLPEDPLVGFLPPNGTHHEGEGSLLFRVSPRSGLGTGAEIRNRATIVFDGDPTPTPDWRVTMDNTPPESRVLPLSASQDSATFTVRWELEGKHPDLRDFSVYVSEDGGEYRLWRGNTEATADTFAGRGGRHYAFYSLAVDSLLNQESAPPTPDAGTNTPVGVGEVGRWTLSLEGALPNPAMGAVRVWFTLPSAERATLEVMDVAGRRLARREVGQLGPGRHIVDLSEAIRRPGLYFVRLAQDGPALRARMVVLR